MPVYVIDVIYPKNNGDFAVTDDQHTRGGFHVCADTAARDAITAQRRKLGMFAWTQSDRKLWRLDVGDVWVEVPIGGTGTASKLETPYTFADYAAGSVLIGIVPAGRTVQSVMLFVDVAFNNGVQFTVGDAGGTARYFTLIENDPARADLYLTDSGTPGLQRCSTMTTQTRSPRQVPTPSWNAAGLTTRGLQAIRTLRSSSGPGA